MKCRRAGRTRFLLDSTCSAEGRDHYCHDADAQQKAERDLYCHDADRDDDDSGDPSWRTSIGNQPAAACSFESSFPWPPLTDPASPVQVIAGASISNTSRWKYPGKYLFGYFSSMKAMGSLSYADFNPSMG